MRIYVGELELSQLRQTGEILLSLAKGLELAPSELVFEVSSVNVPMALFEPAPPVPDAPPAPPVPDAPPAPPVPDAPPAPPVPDAPPAPPVPDAPIGELDSLGMPWDARIHTPVKSKKVDGVWKLKRGVDKALVALVQAETGGIAVSPEQKNEVFKNLVTRVTGLITPPSPYKINHINQLLQKWDIPSIPMLQNAPIETIQAVLKEVEKLCLNIAS